MFYVTISNTIYRNSWKTSRNHARRMNHIVPIRTGMRGPKNSEDKPTQYLIMKSLAWLPIHRYNTIGPSFWKKYRNMKIWPIPRPMRNWNENISDDPPEYGRIWNSKKYSKWSGKITAKSTYGYRNRTGTIYHLTSRNNMQRKLYKLMDLPKSDIFPLGKTRLVELIANGELQKKWELPENENYIIAINVAGWKQRADWLICDSEIEAWAERAKKNLT